MAKVEYLLVDLLNRYDQHKYDFEIGRLTKVEYDLVIEATMLEAITSGVAERLKILIREHEALSEKL